MVKFLNSQKTLIVSVLLVCNLNENILEVNYVLKVVSDTCGALKLLLLRFVLLRRAYLNRRRFLMRLMKEISLILEKNIIHLNIALDKCRLLRAEAFFSIEINFLELFVSDLLRSAAVCLGRFMRF